MSVPHWNTAMTRDRPMEDSERTESMPGAPSTRLSMGTVTSCSTSSGEKPGASVWITTWVGANSGNTSRAMRLAANSASPVTTRAATITVTRLFRDQRMIALTIAYLVICWSSLVICSRYGAHGAPVFKERRTKNRQPKKSVMIVPAARTAAEETLALEQLGATGDHGLAGRHTLPHLHPALVPGAQLHVATLVDIDVLLDIDIVGVVHGNDGLARHPDRVLSRRLHQHLQRCAESIGGGETVEAGIEAASLIVGVHHGVHQHHLAGVPLDGPAHPHADPLAHGD